MRLAFLSTAHVHTRGFLRTAVNDLPDVEVAAIWDDVHERGEDYARQHAVPFTDDLATLLADRSLDGFVICAENTRHMPLLEQVLPTGKPVLCEKPLATTTHDAHHIQHLVRAHGGTLMGGYFQPFNAMNRQALRVIEDGRLGKLTHANFRNAHDAAYGRWFEREAVRWFHDPQLAGGGAMMDMGTHAVHLLRHLCGPAIRVLALATNVSGIYDAVDDYGLVLIEFANGVLGRVEAGWCFTGGSNGLELIGSKQSVWHNGTQMIIGTRDAGTHTPLGEADARPDRIHRLCETIKGNISQDELDDDLAASLDAVVIMDAAYASSRSGTWEDVQSL